MATIVLFIMRRGDLSRSGISKKYQWNNGIAQEEFLYYKNMVGHGAITGPEHYREYPEFDQTGVSIQEA